MHPDYTTAIEIGAATIEVGVDYTYEPGTPERRPCLNFPGEPADPPEVYIGQVYWRRDDPKAPWVKADAVLTALLIDAMCGEECLIEDLCDHAEGRAEEDAYDAAEYRRDMAQEDAA